MCEVPSFLLTLYFVLVMHARVVKNDKIMELTNLHCKVADPKYLNVTRCHYKAVRRGITEVTIEILVLKKPINNASVRGIMRRRGVESGAPLQEFLIDCCGFLRSRRRNYVANLIYRFMGLEKWSNMNHTCPYDHDLLLDKYPFNGKQMGKYMPLPMGHYTHRSMWYTYNVLRIVVDVHFQLYEK